MKINLELSDCFSLGLTFLYFLCGDYDKWLTNLTNYKLDYKKFT